MNTQGVIPVIARASITVGFHPDDVCCHGCPFMRTDTGYRDRARCVLTEEVILYPKHRGLRCPLEFEEEHHGQPNDLQADH